MKFFRNALSLIALPAIFLPAFSQTGNTELDANKTLLKEMVQEDRSVVDALVMYPEETLISILEVCEYPELLVKADGMKQKSQAAFQNLMKEYEMEQQEEMYDLIRYQGLIKALVEGGEKSKDEIKAVLADFPVEIHETAMQYGKGDRYDAIVRIYDMNNTVAEAVENLLNKYPENVQDAIVEVVAMPEIMSLLIDNMSFTVILSDVYKNDPEWVLTKAKERQKVLAEENARELAEYEKSLKEDPEAYNDMLELADQYAKDNGIEDTYKEPQQQAQVNVTLYSYPYWYGYPYWYSTPYWTPVPWYYHTGFYYGPGGAVIFIGYPSGFYVGWHYHYYPNHYHHLNMHYCHYYYRHPYSHNHFYADIDIHVNKNPEVNIDRDKIRNEYKDLWEGSPDFDRAELQRKIETGQIDRNELARKMEDRGLDASSLKERPATSDLYNKETADKALPAKSDQGLQNKVSASDMFAKPTSTDAGRNSNVKDRAQSAAGNSATPSRQPSNSYNNFEAQKRHSDAWNQGTNNYNRPSNNPAGSYSRPTGGGAKYSRPSGGFGPR